MIIRKMTKFDIPAVISIATTNWPNDKRIKHSVPLELNDMFSSANYRPTFFVAEDANLIVGMGAWNWAWHNYDIYEILWGNVLKEYQGQGIGRALVEARLADIKIVSEGEKERRQSYVTVSTHLYKIYEKFGFKSIAIMDLWQNPKTHLMIKML